MESKIEIRCSTVAMSILENEAIAAELDDDCAEIYLKWAVDRAKALAMTTVEIEDDEIALESISSELKLIRLMAKRIGRLPDTEIISEQIEKIIGYAAKLYIDDFQQPEEETVERLAALVKPDMIEFTEKLIQVIEPPSAQSRRYYNYYREI